MVGAAIIGAGRMGVGFGRDMLRWPAGSHLQAYRMVPGVEIVGIADDDMTARTIARSMADPAMDVFESAELLLEHASPTVVSICTPPDARLELVQSCVNHGVRYILCEKPLALSGEEARQIVSLCRESNVSIVVNTQRRFSPVHRMFSDRMRTGAYGQPYWGSAVYTAGLWNTCPHLVDLLLAYFGGAVERVRGVVSRAPCPKEGDLNVDGTLYFKSGLEMSLTALPLDDYTEFGFSAYTPEGLFYTGNHGMSLYRRLVVPSTAFGGCTELSEPVYLGGCDSSRLLALGIASLLEDRPARQDWRAVNVVYVLEALQKSASEGGNHVKVGY